MNKKLVLVMTLMLVLIGMFAVALKVEKVEASGTVYIMADGSVVPDTAPISSVDNITYTFTGNISEPIVVERDNIVVDGAGYTLQGTGSGDGVSLSGRSNVTIKNVEIKAFSYGIYIQSSSKNNTIYGNNITNNFMVIKLESSSNNIIAGNSITHNEKGIGLLDSSNNTISRNNIANNYGQGVRILLSSNNIIYHNNFVNNTEQVYTSTSANFWDNGVEGNYWSNYAGVDSNHDGIGDSPHVIDANNQDNHPLMGMFHSFNALPGYYVNVISNSTIEDFTFFESNSTIKMYVSNMTANQTSGFCRVTIPKNSMSPPYTVIIDDGLTEALYFNDTVYDNGTHRWIYFAYPHSTHKVDIIPEFPTWTSMLLILVVLTVAIAIHKRRQPSHVLPTKTGLNKRKGMRTQIKRRS